MWIDTSNNIRESYSFCPNDKITYEIYKLKTALLSARETNTQDFYRILVKNNQDEKIFIGWGFHIRNEKFKDLDYCKEHCEEHYNFFKEVFLGIKKC